MSQALIELIARFSIEFGIPAALKLVELFDKKDATIADVKASFQAAHTAYEEYEALPAGSTVPPLPPVA